MKILVAITSYNCEKQLPRVLRELDGVLCPEIKKVVVLDNVSSDSTYEAGVRCISSLAGAQIFFILKNEKNLGLGGSQKRAFQMAVDEGFTHLVVLHGDHQAEPRDLLDLIRVSRSHGLCTVLGSRFADLGRLRGYSFVRTAGNIALNWAYSLLSNRAISDLGSGLNLFNLNIFSRQDFEKFDDGFTFNMDVLLHLVTIKAPFVFEPINWSTTDQVSNARALKVGTVTLTKLSRWRLR